MRHPSRVIDRRYGRLLAVLGTAALATGCIGGTEGGGSGGLEFRIVDGAFRTFPEQSVDVISPLYDAGSNEIRLSLAGNETAGFFLELRARQRFNRLSLIADPLTSDSGTLDVAAFEFYSVGFVDAPPPPGWHIKSIDPRRRRQRIPDLLVPASAPRLGQPYALSPNEPLFLWADVTIPAGTAAGHYFGTIRAFDGTQAVAKIPVAVQVLPFDLPPNTDVALLAAVPLQDLLGQHLTVRGRPFTPEHLLRDGPLFAESTSLIRRTLRQLHRHRLSPYLTGCNPVSKVDARGEVTVRWDDYDAVVGEFLNGSPAVSRHWPIPFDPRFPAPPEYEPLTSAGYTRTLRQYLAQCAEHFTQRGWIDKAFVDLPVGVDYSGTSLEQTKGYAEIVRLAGPSLKVLSRYPPQDLRRYGWQDYPFCDLSGDIDIWCPAAQFFDPAGLARPRARGDQTWVALDRPPYSGSVDLLADDTFARVIPWQAVRLGAAAVLLPPVIGPSADSEAPRRTAPLLAPGSRCGLDEPIPTLRLKMLRLGMQDLAYLDLCRRSGQQATADAVTRALCRYAGADAYGVHFGDGQFGGWVRDPTWWNHARKLMIDALRGSAALGTTEWQRFFEATEVVDVHANGTRVHLGDDPKSGGAPQFTIRTSVTIRNQTRSPISGTLSFGELPLGWEPVGTRPTLSSLPPGAAATVTLQARTPTLPAGEDGKTRLPLELKLSHEAEAQRHWADVAHLSVARLSAPLRLDGDPADWPPAVGNVATRFGDISHAGDGAPESAPAADGETLVFTAADARFLYLLFHCATPAPYTHEQVLSNFLTYEDGIPINDEMIEVLIDPANGGTTTPGDLYHLVIKPSGAVLKERGIRAEPQIGSTAPWSADIQVVTRRERKKWIAEVRIPLDAFDSARPAQQTWAINFCRFDAARRAYTNWAAARWNAYNPMSLGNMTLAR